MLLSEADAKTKACCIPDGSYCVGQQCMAWRWSNKIPSRYRRPVIYRGGEPERGPDVPGNWEIEEAGGRLFWAEPEHEWFDRRPGFCGLAGKPFGAE